MDVQLYGYNYYNVVALMWKLVYIVEMKGHAKKNEMTKQIDL